jgi:hypothetical protein
VVSKSAIFHTVHLVARTIAGLHNKYVFSPQADEIKSADTWCRRPVTLTNSGVIGAVGCTHKLNQSPGRNKVKIYRI